MLSKSLTIKSGSAAATSVDLSGLMTFAQEVQQFVDAGVDTLAPAFGNVHGEYGPRGIILEFDR